MRLYLDQCLRSELAGLLRVGFGRLRNNQWPEILRKLGRRAGTLAPADLGQLAGGMGYAAAGRALARFGRPVERTPELRQKIARIQKQM